MQIEMKTSTLVAIVTIILVLAGIGLGAVIDAVRQCLAG